MRGLPACSLGGRAPCRASPAPTGGFQQPSRFRGCGARPGCGLPRMERGGQNAVPGKPGTYGWVIAAFAFPWMRGSPRMGFHHEKRRPRGRLFPLCVCDLPGTCRSCRPSAVPGKPGTYGWALAAFALPWVRGSPRMGFHHEKEAARWPPFSAFRLSFARDVQVLPAERRAGQARHLRVGSCSLRVSVDAGLAPHAAFPI